MPPPKNRFCPVLEEVMVAILKSPDAQIPATVKAPDRDEPANVLITVAKAEDPAACPRIIVKTSVAQEAIYQTGIYKTMLEIMVVTDSDTAAASDANEIFARVVDVIQWTTLKDVLNATGKVFIHGFGSPTLNHNEEFGDRQWLESVLIEVTGFAR